MAAALSRALKLPGKKTHDLGEYDPLTQADSDESEDELVLNYSKNGFTQNGAVTSEPRSTAVSSGHRPAAGLTEEVHKQQSQRWTLEEKHEVEPVSDSNTKAQTGVVPVLRTAAFLLTVLTCTLLVLLCAFLIPCRPDAFWPAQWNKSFEQPGEVALPPLEIWDVDNNSIPDVLISMSLPINESNGRDENSVFVVRALSGIDGETLWTQPIPEEVRFIQCGLQGLGTGTEDVCLLIGTTQLLRAVFARTGATLWEIKAGLVQEEIVAPALQVMDLDEDSRPDLLVTVLPADEFDISFLLISGANGSPVGAPVSFNLTGQGKLIGPQLHVTKGGAHYILFGYGSVEATSLRDIFIQANKKAVLPQNLRPREQSWEKLRRVNSSNLIHIFSGLVEHLVSLSLTPVNCSDLLVASKSRLSLLKGRDLQLRWSTPIHSLHSPPTVGIFNEDKTPDILLQESFDNGLKKVLIIDGYTGQSLWQAVFVSHQRDVEGTSIMTSTGQTAFLFWGGALHPGKNGSTTVPESSQDTAGLQHLYLLHPMYPTILLELTSNADHVVKTAVRSVAQKKDGFYVSIATRPSLNASIRRPRDQVVNRLSLKKAVAHSKIVTIAAPSHILGPFEVRNFFSKLNFKEQ
ncbi:protein FAM234B isoform X2 [Polypterus senegalus]|uniref:protein FAM234B isoform X2 n=1 Tax=Polypterus senegalus TaxID=55291 RepID=UPI00196685A8|nr:protein FAM234B isoform X2 [Polypterus senegalus]